MDAFRETTPEEARLIALQFMGQNIGDIKELDKNIISKNPTLQGNTLNVQNVLNSIPVQQKAQQHAAVRQSAPRPAFVPPAPGTQTLPAVSSNNDALVAVLNKVSDLLETIIKLLDKR